MIVSPARRCLVVALLAGGLAGCAGESPLERCVGHSVEEGVERGVAERACREAGIGD